MMARRIIGLSLLLALLLQASPATAQDDLRVEIGSFVRIEYTRYFARRREIVDSADVARANRWRQFEVRGRVEELSDSHVLLRAHDRTFSVQRWQIDRAWLYVHTAESEHAGESMTEWGLGGIVTAGIVGGLLAASCDDGDSYCGLAVLILMTGVATAGLIAGVLDAIDDADQDFVEVLL